MAPPPPRFARLDHRRRLDPVPCPAAGRRACRAGPRAQGEHLAASRFLRSAHGNLTHVRRHARRRPAHAAHRHRRSLARHHVPLSGPQPRRLAADPAAGDADLHHRLRLRRPAGLLGSGAVGGSLARRLARRPRVLVPRHPQYGRRDTRSLPRTLSVRLPFGPRELPAAVGLRPRGRPHTRAHAAANLFRRRPAARAPGSRRRHDARADGVSERYRGHAISGRQDADRRGL